MVTENSLPARLQHVFAVFIFHVVQDLGGGALEVGSVVGATAVFHVF